MAVTTIPQHLVAHQLAQDRRLARAEMIRQVREGLVNPVELVLAPPDCLATMFLFDFVRQVPMFGPIGVKRMNRRAINRGYNLAVSLGELGDERAEWVSSWLATPARRRRLASMPQG